MSENKKFCNPEVVRQKLKLLTINFIAVLLFTATCSSSDSGSVDGDGQGAASAVTAASIAASEVPPSASTAPTTTSSETEVAVGEVSMLVPFTAGNGTGTIAIFGDGSPVAEWFASQPGEITLDLLEADVNDAGSVVEELVSFWFFRDDDSGDVPPSIFESTSGNITDSIGTSYVVETQLLPPAPGTEITTTTISPPEPSPTTTTSDVPSETPETSMPPSTTSTTTTTTTTSTTTTTTSTTTTTTTLAPVVLRVQVLNGSGVAGVAGRLTDKLSQAGFDVLPAGNAPRRYSASAVYYAEGWLAEAEEILAEADIEEIEEPTKMPQQFASEEAVVVVLLGTDTAPARAQARLRPRQRNDVKLPLGDDVPRDRYVPGLSNINMYSEQNENDPVVFGQLVRFRDWLLGIHHHQNEDNPQFYIVNPESRQTRQGFLSLLQAIEEYLEWFGFTPQNVCGAPAGYSFTDLWQPIREWNEDLLTYSGLKVPITTDMLLEWHGGERINPEANLDFYIQQAVQTWHDIHRLDELREEVETPQMILCWAWKVSPDNMPFIISVYLNYLTLPGLDPAKHLESQTATYHFKAISRNGNLAYLIECQPDKEHQFIMLWWRNGGYRASSVILKTYNIDRNDALKVRSRAEGRPSGCQEQFDEYDDILNGLVPDEWTDRYWTEDLIFFNFGERVFSASDLLDFPRG